MAKQNTKTPLWSNTVKNVKVGVAEFVAAVITIIWLDQKVGREQDELKR
jgi:tagatose-1,6-bisphosphate aldolase